MKYDALQRQVAELQISGTMNKLARFAQSMPIDVTDKEQLNEALCTVTVSLIRALDNDRIQFADDEDNAMLHGLLLIALQVVFDGKFAADTSPATVQ